MTFPAMNYAIKHHGDQTYGDNEIPYREHLFAVVQVLKDVGLRGPWLDAGALHDVIEDTGVTRRDLNDEFGQHVGDLVWAVSGIGRNREIRNATIYAKISMLPAAAIVKMADRIANVENSVPGSGHAKMYLKERTAFYANVASRVLEDYDMVDMYDRLERAYARLQGETA